MSLNVYDKAGNTKELVEKNDLIFERLSFQTNTSCYTSIGSKGCAIVCIGLNGNLGYVFDIVYYNGSVQSVKRLGTVTNVEYSISDNTLQINQTTNWSTGFVIKT